MLVSCDTANTPCTTVNPAGLERRKRKDFEILNMHCVNCLQLYISLSWCVSVIEVYVFINMGRGRHILLIVHTFAVPGCLSWVLEGLLNCSGKSSGMLDNEVHCLLLILFEPFRVKFPVRFLDFVVGDAGSQTKLSQAIWFGHLFFCCCWMNSRKLLEGICVFNWSVVCNQKTIQSFSFLFFPLFSKFGSVRGVFTSQK